MGVLPVRAAAVEGERIGQPLPAAHLRGERARELAPQLQQLDTQVGILTTQYAHIAADYKRIAALLAQA